MDPELKNYYFFNFCIKNKINNTILTSLMYYQQNYFEPIHLNQKNAPKNVYGLGKSVKSKK